VSSLAAFAGLHFHRPNPNGWHLLIDSTGLKMLGEGEYPRAPMENQEVGGGVSPPMAQGSLGYRRRNAGN